MMEQTAAGPTSFELQIEDYRKHYQMLRRLDNYDRELDDSFHPKVGADMTPLDGVYSFDVIVDPTTNLLSRIYRKSITSASVVVPVIIFFHGGSFVHSSYDTSFYDEFCRNIVIRCNAVVVSVNYRRSPEHRYPCAYDDGFAALKWVHSQTWLGSGNPYKAHVYLMGDSSGGNIAHHVSVRAVESKTSYEVLGNILVHPMFGGKEMTKSEVELDGWYYVTMEDRDWYWKKFLPEGADRDHHACNPFGSKGRHFPFKGKNFLSLFTKSKDKLNFPKTFVAIANLDLSKDWQREYAERLKKGKNNVEVLYLATTIGYYLSTDSFYYDTLMEEIKKFVS